MSEKSLFARTNLNMQPKVHRSATTYSVQNSISDTLRITEFGILTNADAMVVVPFVPPLLHDASICLGGPCVRFRYLRPVKRTRLGSCPSVTDLDRLAGMAFPKRFAGAVQNCPRSYALQTQWQRGQGYRGVASFRRCLVDSGSFNARHQVFPSVCSLMSTGERASGSNRLLPKRGNRPRVTPETPSPKPPGFGQLCETTFNAYPFSRWHCGLMLDPGLELTNSAAK